VVVQRAGSVYSLSFRLFDGSVIPARDPSQGLLAYVFFLALVHRSDGPAVLLVEEPENGLHPLRIAEVLSLLRRFTAQGIPVLVTTHSPELLSACTPA